MNLNDYFIVGVVGPVVVEFDKDEQRIIHALLDQTILKEKDSEVSIAIATGFTDVGINKVVHRWAWENALPVVGVSCNLCWEFPVWMAQKRIITGDEWGDESQTFVAILNGLIQFSDTPQAKEEAELADAAGIQVLNLSKEFNNLISSPFPDFKRVNRFVNDHQEW